MDDVHQRRVQAVLLAGYGTILGFGAGTICYYYLIVQRFWTLYMVSRVFLHGRLDRVDRGHRRMRPNADGVSSRR